GRPVRLPERNRLGANLAACQRRHAHRREDGPDHEGHQHQHEQRCQDHRKRHGRTPLEWRRRRKPSPYVVAVTGLETRRTARTATFHNFTLMAVSPSSSTRLLCQLLPSNRAAWTASAVPPWLRLAVI